MLQCANVVQFYKSTCTFHWGDTSVSRRASKLIKRWFCLGSSKIYAVSFPGSFSFFLFFHFLRTSEALLPRRRYLIRVIFRDGIPNKQVGSKCVTVNNTFNKSELSQFMISMLQYKANWFDTRCGRAQKPGHQKTQVGHCYISSHSFVKRNMVCAYVKYGSYESPSKASRCTK